MFVIKHCQLVKTRSFVVKYRKRKEQVTIRYIFDESFFKIIFTMSINIFLLNNSNIFNYIIQRMNEGGAFFMYTLLLILLLETYLILKVISRKAVNEKQVSLINSISLFALVFGFLGQIFGMIQVFDAIEFDGNISSNILGGGIKVTSLSPAFGMFVFLVGRLGTILIIAFKK